MSSLPKDRTIPFNGPNSRPVSLLQVRFLRRQYLIKYKILRKQSDKKCSACLQKGTLCTVQVTDDWNWDLDNKMICGAILLHFTAACDLIDHKLLLEKLECYVQQLLKWKVI